jgi:DNA-binding beta-propeller fold protein YncE
MRATHKVGMSAALLLMCGATPLLAQEAPAGVLKVVVANQQSSSASILADDGRTMKHVEVGAGPHEAAVSPDGHLAVVTVYGTQAAGNQLAVLDLVRDSVIRTISLGEYTRPHGVVFLGDSNTRVAVTSESTNSLLVIDVVAETIEAIPTEARGSHMVAVERTGRRAWTANVLDGTVSELDLEQRRFVRAFDVPWRPEGIAVTPDGAEVWVGSNDTGEVTVISTVTGSVLHTLTGATFPYRLAASPDGSLMAIVDAMGHALRIAEVSTRRSIADVHLDSPRGAVIGSDNRTAYVTLAHGSVAIIDLAEGRILRTLTVQDSPDGVGVGIRSRTDR